MDELTKQLQLLHNNKALLEQEMIVSDTVP